MNRVGGGYERGIGGGRGGAGKERGCKVEILWEWFVGDAAGKGGMGRRGEGRDCVIVRQGEEGCAVNVRLRRCGGRLLKVAWGGQDRGPGAEEVEVIVAGGQAC